MHMVAEGYVPTRVRDDIQTALGSLANDFQKARVVKFHSLIIRVKLYSEQASFFYGVKCFICISAVRVDASGEEHIIFAVVLNRNAVYRALLLRMRHYGKNHAVINAAPLHTVCE